MPGGRFFSQKEAGIAALGFVKLGKMADEELVRKMQLYQPDYFFRYPGQPRRS
jgi:hypothetical protein